MFCLRQGSIAARAAGPTTQCSTQRGRCFCRGSYPLEAVKTHKSVLRLFSLEFVQRGTFKPELARALRKAPDARHVADYEGGVLREDAAEVMAALGAFMNDAEAFLGNAMRGQP